MLGSPWNSDGLQDETDYCMLAVPCISVRTWISGKELSAVPGWTLSRSVQQLR